MVGIVSGPAYRSYEAAIIGKVDNSKNRKPVIKNYLRVDDKIHKRKPRTRVRHYG